MRKGQFRMPLTKKSSFQKNNFYWRGRKKFFVYFITKRLCFSENRKIRVGKEEEGECKKQDQEDEKANDLSQFFERKVICELS